MGRGIDFDIYRGHKENILRSEAIYYNTSGYALRGL